jgi:hypothetical protein
LTDGADGSPENWLIGLLPVAEHIAVQSGFLTAAGLEVLGPALGLALAAGARLSPDPPWGFRSSFGGCF